MIQAKFTIKESHIEFIEQYKQYGFKDKSDVVRAALDHLSSELAKQRLMESATLYAEVYEEDDETKEWTDASLSEWTA
ncbi:MAG: hypothetical protein JW927_14680 [Deltaproteobacteria bacterium]|nr:hypothetical protein [Deltaproteobacteria bacterium]